MPRHPQLALFGMALLALGLLSAYVGVRKQGRTLLLLGGTMAVAVGVWAVLLAL
jgi:hypothetical protein